MWVESTSKGLTRIQGEIVRHALRDLEAEPTRRRIVGVHQFLGPCLTNSDLVSLDETSRKLRRHLSLGKQTPRKSAANRTKPSQWIGSRVRCHPLRGCPTLCGCVRSMRSTWVTDPLEHKKYFCRDPTVWISKKLPDGKATEVSNHRLLSSQQLPLDEATTQELSQVLAAGWLGLTCQSGANHQQPD